MPDGHAGVNEMSPSAKADKQANQDCVITATIIFNSANHNEALHSKWFINTYELYTKTQLC